MDLENNLLIRTLLYPVMNTKRSMEQYFYRYTASSEKIRKLKNSHVGERCFIVGNGPSVKSEDLELIRYEFCFGFNRIFEIFALTSWRPDIYMCVDKNILKECYDIITDFDFPVFLAQDARKYQTIQNSMNITYIENYVPFLIHRYRRIQNIKFSRDASLGMYGGATVTYTAMQLAAYMGFREIYLLGIDHSYSKTVNSRGELVVDKSIKDYFGNMKSMPYTIQAIDTVEAAYRTAYQYCKNNNVKIYNATRGGKLEIFPRVKLESIVKKKDMVEDQ